MNEYEKLQRADLRLRVLQVLVAVPGYRANDALIRQELATRYAHVKSQDALRTELAWLAEQGLLVYNETGSVAVAAVTQRGQECANGVANVPGVARPSPEEMLAAAGIGLMRRQ